MKTKTALGVLLGVLSTLSLPAQSCPGGPQAFLDVSPMVLGEEVRLTLYGGVGEFFVVLGADELAIAVVPGLGNLCIDPASPSFRILGSGILDATGQATVSFVVPDTSYFADLVYFLQAVVTSPGGLRISNALRLDYEAADSTTAVPGATGVAVAGRTANLMGDARVLVTGGAHPNGIGSVSATDIFDPVSRSWTPGPAMSDLRVDHAAVTLADGRVLICGGTNFLGIFVHFGCDIYDPFTGVMRPTAPMPQPRANHSAILLDDGRVLVAGGRTTPIDSNLKSAIVFDPVAETWTPVGDMSIFRRDFSLSRLPDGRILAAGGRSTLTLPQLVTATTEIFDPVSNLFTPAPSLPAPRFGHAAAADDAGRTWIVGGLVPPTGSTNSASGVPTVQTAILDGFGTWSAGPNLPNALSRFALVRVEDGSLVCLGGDDGLSTSSAIVRLHGAQATAIGSLTSPRAGVAASLLFDGSILIANGYNKTADPNFASTIVSLDDGQIFMPGSF